MAGGTVLITGIAGFTGFHLAAELRAALAARGSRTEVLEGPAVDLVVLRSEAAALERDADAGEAEELLVASAGRHRVIVGDLAPPAKGRDVTARSSEGALAPGRGPACSTLQRTPGAAQRGGAGHSGAEGIRPSASMRLQTLRSSEALPRGARVAFVRPRAGA